MECHTNLHLDMRLGILTCLWERDAVERFTLEYLANLRPGGIDVELVAVGSEGVNSMARCPHSVFYVEAPNDPLGAKWNAGLRACGLLECDAVMTLGSDDLVTAGTIEGMVAGLRHGTWVQPHGTWMWDVPTDRVMYARFDTGAGRVYSKPLLDRVGWELWPNEANVKLDGCALDKIIKARGHRHERPDLGVAGPILDIKTPTNMWAFDTIAGVLESPLAKVTAREVLEWFRLDHAGVRAAVS